MTLAGKCANQTQICPQKPRKNATTLRAKIPTYSLLTRSAYSDAIWEISSDCSPTIDPTVLDDSAP